MTREMEKNGGDEGAAVKKLEDEWAREDDSEEDSTESDESEDFSETTDSAVEKIFLV